MKDITTLIPDIYAVIEGKGGWDATITEYLSTEISKIAEVRFSEEQKQRGYLSMSSLGTPCQRKLWYQVNQPEDAIPLGAKTLGNFFYGDLIEALVLSLAKAAGHSVEGEQDTMEINGIKGHRDAVIDGMTVDVKSAAGRGMGKFYNNNLVNDDPFGYLSQLSSYVYAGKDDPLVLDKTHGAFLAVNKERFELALDIYNFEEYLTYKEEEVEYTKSMVAHPTPPDRLPDVPQSKTSPNRVLGVTCSYCPFKYECWPNLRMFQYAKGPVYMTQVIKTPDVPEGI